MIRRPSGIRFSSKQFSMNLVGSLCEPTRESVVGLPQLKKLVRVANGSSRGGFRAGTSVAGYGFRA